MVTNLASIGDTVFSEWCYLQTARAAGKYNLLHHLVRTMLEQVGRGVQSVQPQAMAWMVRGSNPSGDEIFCTCPDQPWGPSSLLYNGYWVFLRGKDRPGPEADPHTPFQCRRHKRVELYLCSPYGLYGVYRASVPVQGCTLLFYLSTTYYIL